MSTAIGTIALETFDGAAVLAELDRFVSLYQQVYTADADLPDHCDPPLAQRLARTAARPGFAAVVATGPAGPAGYVYGYPLPAQTGWWEGLTPAPEPELVREWPGRTFAICEGLVHVAYRRGGLASRMHARLLAGRPEQRAAALVAVGNTVVRNGLVDLGWQHVGDLEPYPGWRRHAAYLLPLHESAGAR